MIYAKMLVNITTNAVCRKDDIVIVKYLYDGKYQLLNKVGESSQIGYQCYEDQIKILSKEEALKLISKQAREFEKSINENHKVEYTKEDLKNLLKDGDIVTLHDTEKKFTFNKSKMILEDEENTPFPITLEELKVEWIEDIQRLTSIYNKG